MYMGAAYSCSPIHGILLELVLEEVVVVLLVVVVVVVCIVCSSSDLTFFKNIRSFKNKK